MRLKLKSLYRKAYAAVFGTSPGYPIIKPIDTNLVEVLADPEFQASCREVRRYTLLDTPRLANLWSLCRTTSPQGHILEVGSYRGGGALHLSNSCPQRKIIACDSFLGFEKLDPTLDNSFSYGMFKNTSHQAVDHLFAKRNRNYVILTGFFPAVCRNENFDLGPISFVHLDVDAYKPTIESLEYLDPFMLDRSLIILDDFNRNANGITRAVHEFIVRRPSWVVFPLFPGQGLLVHRGWFHENNR